MTQESFDSTPGGTGLTEGQEMFNEPGGSEPGDMPTIPPADSTPGGTGLTESSDMPSGPGGTSEEDASMQASAESCPGGTVFSGTADPMNGPGGTGGESELNNGGTGDFNLEWFRSSDDVRTGSIRLTSGSRTVQYSVIDGLAIFEGDICLGKVEDIESWTAAVDADSTVTPADRPEFSDLVVHGVGITGDQFRWPLGGIPYVIASNVPSNTKTIIEDAINHWHQNSLIRLRPRDGEQNYVRFISGNGCWSYVGRQGGVQEISIGAGCGFGAAVHEIGHAVGLWHEQSREDRNDHVIINWQNIQPGREHNFNQHISDGDDIGPYDFGSIMHYGPTAFSSNGQPTIVTINGEAIGQRNGLSPGDIAAVEALYLGIATTSQPHLRYSALWNAGTHAQVWWPLCSESQFRSKTGQLWSNMRVKQMHAVVLGGTVRYACMWEPGTYGQVWWPNCSERQFRDLTSRLWSWARPAQVQAFVVGGQVRYSCLWNAGTHGQIWWPNCSERQFRDLTSRLWSWARPAQVQAFVVGGQVRYSCLWNAGTHGQIWWPLCTEEQVRMQTTNLWDWARPAQWYPVAI